MPTVKPQTHSVAMSGYGAQSPSAAAMDASSSAVGAGVWAAHLGVTRSRTLLFQSYRESAPRSRRGAASWGASTGDLTTTSTTDDDPYAQYSQNASLYYHDDDYRNGRGNGSAYGFSSPYDKGKRRAGGTYFDSKGDLRHEQAPANGDSSYPPVAHHSIDMGALPPRWVDISDQVDHILDGLQPKIAHLDKLHTKHVLPGFTDRSKEERDIERETAEITKEFRRCSKLIASLAHNTKSLAQQGKASAREIAMASNVQTALATKVQDASGAFRRKQTNYMQRLRGHEERHHDVHGGNNVTRDSEVALQEDMELSRQYLSNNQGRQEQSQLLLEEQDRQQPGYDDAQIMQRDREIDQIARSIAELAELFQDLSALVIDQGTMLDRIDFNIEHMGQDMQAAVRELSQATVYQKRTSRGQCILFLVLLIFLVITVIIVKPFWRFLFGA